ncbi:hypothetical protein OIO90_000814 [Microbotryomycetes sp. JL221]|nr:hypothetical protein OIO90_000814 [Microbotryomycetes sp. JL221]
MLGRVLLLATVTIASAAQIPFSSKSEPGSVRLRPESSTTLANDGSFTTLTHNDFEHHAVRIKNTTGWCEENAQSMTGYIDAHGRSLFFYFFASRTNPDKDPVLLWTNGGPGASSALGLFTENGPCTINSDGNSTKSSPYAWNEHANVIFIDQPAGVGLSYTEPGVSVSTSEQAAIDVHAFLAILFESVPKLRGRALHLSGESYGGRYLPLQASRIVHENEKLATTKQSNRAPLNLKSILIGNGLTDAGSMIRSYYEQACSAQNGLGRPVIDILDCIGMQAEVKRCENWFQRACRDHHAQPECDIAVSYCSQVIEERLEANSINPYDISKKCPTLDRYMCFPEWRVIETYLNRPWVRKKLGIDDRSGNFSSTNRKLNRRFAITRDGVEPTFYHLTALLERQIGVLVYVGRLDYACNWIGNSRMLENLEWSGQDQFNTASLRRWKGFEGSSGGNTKSRGKLTYMDFDGAGHMVPMDKPAEASYMLKQWLKGNEF